jgi:hypothetical protein
MRWGPARWPPTVWPVGTSSAPVMPWTTRSVTSDVRPGASAEDMVNPASANGHSRPEPMRRLSHGAGEDIIGQATEDVLKRLSPEQRTVLHQLTLQALDALG